MRNLLSTVLIIFFTFNGVFTSVVSEGVVNGGGCDLDSDCVGKLDCIRVGIFEKRCAPVSCAKGAGQAVLNTGFKPGEYIGNLLGSTGLSRRSFLSLGETDTNRLSSAMKETPLPREVFNANFTACLNPSDSRNLQSTSSETDTWYGLQWSAAALFSYFGKVTWKDRIVGPCPFCDDVRDQFLQNCIGFLVGGDAGLDVLFQIYTATDGRRNVGPDTESDTEYVPVITAGPVGVQVGWFKDDGGPDGGMTITEVTLGPSLGAALGGYSNCFADFTTEDV